MYVDIPQPLTESAFKAEFGSGALAWYKKRLKQRVEDGKVYPNLLKTAYIWAFRDRISRQGYFGIDIIRNRNNRKRRNFGRS